MDKIIRDSIFTGIAKVVHIGMVLVVCSAVAAGQDRVALDETNSMVYNGIRVTQDAARSPVLNTIISIHAKDVPLLEAVKEIAAKANLEMVYNSKLLEKKNRPITIRFEQVSVEKALWSALEGTGLRFAVSANKQLVLLERREAKDSRQRRSAKVQETITGTVTDAQSGETLPGVNILVKGTSTGASTDANGQYELEVESLQDTLVVSFVGYKTQQVPINGRTEIDIEMQSQAISGEEMVVVGYGEQKKSNLTDAVSTVDIDKAYGSRPVSNLPQTLKGAVPGLEIHRESGRPGTRSSLNIRGIESINGGSPLVLVDNVPMDINDVNPEDVKSVQVLKGPAASSIYGGRAAFGAIIITTKQGNKNQPIHFKYSNNIAVTKPVNLPKKASTLEYVQALKDFGTIQGVWGQNLDTWEKLLVDYQKNPGKYPKGETTVNGTLYRLAQHSMFKSYMNNGFEQRHNFSFSGGSANTSYRVSLGYTNDDGIMVTNKDSYKKYNVNTSLTAEITKKLDATAKVFYFKDRRLKPAPGRYTWMTTAAVIDQNTVPTKGHYTTDSGKKLPYMVPYNLIKFLKPRKNFDDNLRLFGRLNFKPLKGLNIQGEYTYSKQSVNLKVYRSTKEFWHPAAGNIKHANNMSSYIRGTSDADFYALNVYADYNRSFKKHNIKVKVGTNLEKHSNESYRASRNNVISGDVPALSTATGTIGATDSFGQYAVLGYFGRLRYNYNNTYLLEVNGRYDGSSRFPGGHKYGFFPSASAGWIVSNEPFMKSLKSIISNLKLRASWGEIGNQDISDFTYFPGFAPYKAGWINPGASIRAISLTTPNLVSSNFSWEKVRTLGFGANIGLFNNRGNISFDWFKRQTLGMLAPGAEQPAVLGTAAPQENVANLESKGWELKVGWSDNIDKFSYSLSVSLSDNRGYITKFDNPSMLISQYYKGQEIGGIWGYITKGFYSIDDFVKGTLNDNLTGGKLKPGVPYFKGLKNKENPGDVRYVDLNGDGFIYHGNNTLHNPGDRKIIGNNHRRYVYGVTGDASFKGFDLSFLFQGVGKRDMWISNRLFWPYYNRFSPVWKHTLDYWTPKSPNTYYPRNYPNADGNSGTNRQVQTKYLSNGAYLRIKNITIGYTLPKRLIKKSVLKKVRIFVSGENLFTFDHLPDGLSPEERSISSGLGYPHIKQYSFGIDVTF